MEYVPCMYSCFTCGTDLSFHNDIVKTTFVCGGKGGRGILFSHVRNIVEGPKESRNLITGPHVVSDIYCSCCNTKLGWRYDKAFDYAQKYKEGKFVLQKSLLSKEFL